MVLSLNRTVQDHHGTAVFFFNVSFPFYSLSCQNISHYLKNKHERNPDTFILPAVLFFFTRAFHFLVTSADQRLLVLGDFTATFKRQVIVLRGFHTLNNEYIHGSSNTSLWLCTLIYTRARTHRRKVGCPKPQTHNVLVFRNVRIVGGLAFPSLGNQTSCRGNCGMHKKSANLQLKYCGLPFGHLSLCL